MWWVENYKREGVVAEIHFAEIAYYVRPYLKIRAVAFDLMAWNNADVLPKHTGIVLVEVHHSPATASVKYWFHFMPPV